MALIEIGPNGTSCSSAPAGLGEPEQGEQRDGLGEPVGALLDRLVEREAAAAAEHLRQVEALLDGHRRPAHVAQVERRRNR